MDGNASCEDVDNIDWDTEDELEIQDIPVSSCSRLTPPGEESVAGTGEASSSVDPSSHSKLVHHFIGMGFSEKLVTKAIEENGQGNTESILETLLTYSVSLTHFETLSCSFFLHRLSPLILIGAL
ncbi:unnamed protein product [Ilex paraguariensis]|uniref:UBA domain-containing protein n=1 Tax=Ilex paraguariensis TaxID=185542 RepID=A0ABC8UF50_9AQUA